MKKLQTQKGFTLVELAIVLTIIGLLIGGILKGQQLMQNARVTATIAQVNAIEAATTTFRDTYNAIPGDMPSADTRIANCGNCKAYMGTATGGSGGDGVVGMNNWDAKTPQATAAVTSVGADAKNETILYWAELAQAGLLAGITADGVTTGGVIAFGTALPSARLGGGWLVGQATGSQAPSIKTDGGLSMTGTVLMLTTSASAVATSTAGQQVLTPTIAAQIDRKMDDSVPSTGFLQDYGALAASAGGSGCIFGSAAPYAYNESTNSKDCGIYFRIQG